MGTKRGVKRYEKACIQLIRGEGEAFYFEEVRNVHIIPTLTGYEIVFDWDFDEEFRPDFDYEFSTFEKITDDLYTGRMYNLQTGEWYFVELDLKC